MFGFEMPPKTKTAQGSLRRVGFEIEFGGVALETTARIIHHLQGGKISKKNQFSWEVQDTAFGTFSIESDSRFLSQKTYSSYLEKIGVKPDSEIVGKVENVLEKLSGTLLPFEIAMPPLPLDQLAVAEQIREVLFQSSAQGTRVHPFAAFGAQINPELPDLKVESILSILRAFLLLFDILKKEADLVFARKVAPYIHPFPSEYVNRILDEAYKPSTRQMIIDYLKWNPTRNRPLDLLPLFCFIDKNLVFSFEVERELVKARPTFHYRLPNSEIDDPHWTLAEEWNKWVQIEKLAAAGPLLTRLSREYQRVGQKKSEWILTTAEWFHET